jgi:hypothetical protein
VSDGETELVAFDIGEGNRMGAPVAIFIQAGGAKAEELCDGSIG